MNLFSHETNLDDLHFEEKEGIIKLLEETLKLTKEREEYEKYLVEGGNLPRQEWKQSRLSP